MQKPEYWLANKYGLITDFDSASELASALTRKDDHDERERAKFLNENCAELVAQRVLTCLRGGESAF